MRLRHSTIEGDGILRRRRGRGFSYVTSAGEVVRDEETLRRIRELAIPPAWRKVWICAYPNGHIQAVGRDAAGRKQYLYHAQWRRERDEEKFDRVLELATRLPDLRERLRADLDRRGLDEDRVLAAAITLLDSGVLRVGGEEYAETNGSHGVATLLREHVRVHGARIALDFPAKSGIRCQAEVCDVALAKALRALLTARTDTQRLFVYRDRTGLHEVHADTVNARFRELTGPEFSVKDLRTWQATVLAAAGLATVTAPSSVRGRKTVVRQVMSDVAELLGNTPAVVRASYVDPRVLRAFEEGVTIAAALGRARRADSPQAQRDIVDRAVIRLLRRTHQSAAIG
ncbi:DNA topoisomerase IB [Nocardia yamanashiensis]|uniref:DNA topoisomerase IB n=1 Tax=Nocardia yamanashiensis TaxID=209247 RepID=UPI001E59945F|nr:DNA topoisomerase IB [Nocardia yamanashiensis]UGT43547.1 DNA topoisomerase IB [Nocardia yamanashiensis]